MTIQTVSNKYGVAKWIVDPVLGRGTHQTITAAYTSASSGDTIAVRPGTYTEDPTIKPGTTLVAFNGDQANPNVTIVGTCTMTGAGTSTISNIRLQTNSAFAVAVTGSAASILNLNNCFLNFTNNTGISFTSSSSSASISIYNSPGDLGTTGIAYFNQSSPGGLKFVDCNYLLNSGSSTTANTMSAGIFNLINSRLFSPITTSSTSIFVSHYSSIECAAINVSALTHNSTSAACTAFYTYFNSGTASAITMGVGSSLVLLKCSMASGNVNAITETGASTLNYTPIDFQQAGTNVNITTQGLLNIGPRMQVGGNLPGLNANCAVANSSNTASSSATFKAFVGGTTASDPYNTWTVGNTRSYAAGIDNSDSQRFKITTAAAVTVDPSSGTTILTSDATNIWVTGLSFDSGVNVLANYVTGTFTPTLVGSSTAGTTTYTTQKGYYTRIGNIVMVQANVAGSAATGTGSAIFGGLPFTIKNQTGGNPAGSVLSANNATWVFPVGTTCQAMDGLINTITASIYCSGTATVGGNLQMANAAFNFIYTMIYQI